jgi:hypothetical protein
MYIYLIAGSILFIALFALLVCLSEKYPSWDRFCEIIAPGLIMGLILSSVIIMIFPIFIFFQYREINSNQYSKIQEVILENPQYDYLLKAAMEDNKINDREYQHILWEVNEEKARQSKILKKSELKKMSRNIP